VHFLDLFQNLNGDFLLVVGNMAVDSETRTMTLSILKICKLSPLEMLIGIVLRACIHVG
jgi:hypothetical protein